MATSYTSRVVAVLLAIFIIAVAIAVGSKQSIQRGSALPTPSEWAGSIATSTTKTLAGKVTVIGGGSLTLMAQQPDLGSTVVSVSPSIPVTKDTPKSPAELAAAFREYQRLQKAANGKPFVAPSGMDIQTISFSDIQVGESVLITLTPSSTKGNFVAQKIEVMPAL